VSSSWTHFKVAAYERVKQAQREKTPPRPQDVALFTDLERLQNELPAETNAEPCHLCGGRVDSDAWHNGLACYGCAPLEAIPTENLTTEELAHLERRRLAERDDRSVIRT
jgi:hypothetical protein